MKICAIPGCAGQYASRGLCKIHLEWAKRHRVRFPQVRSTTCRLGMWGEGMFAKLLTEHGRTVVKQHVQAPFDLLVDGWRVDVKCSEPHARSNSSNPTKRWQIKCHKDANGNRDFYLLSFQKFSNGKPMNFLLRAPLGIKGVVFTKATLMSRFPNAHEDFLAFARGEFGFKPTTEVSTDGHGEEAHELSIIGGDARAD